MNTTLSRLSSPAYLAPGLTGLILIGLLFGFEPVGGDPDRLYRPLKQELARALSEGRLPFWSEQFGLGLPLVAESHVAAFYPPNALFYRLLDVATAYRLAFWLHYVLLAAATAIYGRLLNLSWPAASLASIAFTFCGFQAIHSSHEPFYHALPYLVGCLALAEWHLMAGRALPLILLALTWAAQLTLGHFQIQMWTAGLVLLIGLWRTIAEHRPWRRLFGLVVSLGCGALAASPQLVLSWELSRFVGMTERSFNDLAFFGFPLAHWAEAFFPGMVRGIKGGPEAPYWYMQGTTGYEACFYLGTIPLLLVPFAIGRGRNRRLDPWLAIILMSFALAVMPGFWPQGYQWVTSLPGIGWFRAPGRYLLLTCLGLALWGGAGLDRLTAARRAGMRIVMAWCIVLAAGGWVAYWSLRPDHVQALGGRRLWLCLGGSGLCWVVMTLLVIACRRGRLGLGVLSLATACELGALYYTATTEWGWSIALPQASPILSRLAEEPGLKRVAGHLQDLPVRAGAVPAFPYTGFALPPPHPALEAIATRHDMAFSSRGQQVLLRYGTTHGIWNGSVPEGSEVLLESEDPALDAVTIKQAGSPDHARWRLVRLKDAYPPARAVTRIRTAPDDRSLRSAIASETDPATAWFLQADRPETANDPAATTAKVISWDGTTAVVEHDGACDLIIHRTYYPGWLSSVDDGPFQVVSRAEAGIQAVTLAGKGTHRVRFVYAPSHLGTAVKISLATLGVLAVSLLLAGGLEWRRLRLPPGAEPVVGR